MSKLVSIYSNTADAAKYERLLDRAADHGRGTEDRAIRCLFSALLTLGAALCVGLGYDGTQQAANMMFFIGAVFTLLQFVVVGPVLMSEFWLARSNKYHSLLGEHAIDLSSYPELAQHHLETLNRDLSSLPADLRADLRPLWDAALVAADATRENVEDGEAWRALDERLRAVRAIMVQQENLEREVKPAVPPAIPRAKQKLQDLDNSDLKLAEIYATALKAGRERIKEIN